MCVSKSWSFYLKPFTTTETYTVKTAEKLGQELAFDLDPENITCPIHGSLADKMKRQQGLSFCELEFEMVKKEAIGLYDFLEKRFSDLKVVYSGQRAFTCTF